MSASSSARTVFGSPFDGPKYLGHVDDGAAVRGERGGLRVNGKVARPIETQHERWLLVGKLAERDVERCGSDGNGLDPLACTGL